MRPQLLLCVAVALLVAADDPDPEVVKQDMKKLAGTWRRVSLVEDGKKIPPDEGKIVTLTLEENGKWAQRRGGETVTAGTFTIDPTKRPKQAQFSGTSGAFKGKSTRDIYELDGDTLRFCYVIPEKDEVRPSQARPPKFASEAGTGHCLEVLKRERAKGAKKEGGPDT